MTTQAKPVQEVVFVLLPKFSMIALYGALEPLRVANRFAGRVFSWRFVSLDGEPVSASNEIPVSVSGELGAVGRPALVIFCASYEPEKHVQRKMLAKVRQLARQGVTLGGVDTGPFVLASAGLLDGYRATVHWESLPGFRESFPSVDVTTALYEIDRDRMTCEGGAASIDMMLEYVARTHDRKLAVTVADQLVHFRFSDGAGEARLPAQVRYQISHPRVLSVIDAMEQNIEEPLEVTALARLAGLSVRQMERLFRAELAMPPKRFYQQLRLERAERLLNYSHMTVTDVAVACGFPALEHFTRSYKARFGAPPSRHRRIGQNVGMG